MNIQLNLLPEARLSKLRNQARRRRYGALAALITGIILATIAIFFLLLGFLVSTYQISLRNVKDLKASLLPTKDIQQQSATLQANLAKFYDLNEKRTEASKLFISLFDATPSNVTIESLSISSDDQVTITGSTGTFADVGTYSKSLQEYNLNYKPQPNLDRQAIFTDVKITSVSKDENSAKTSFTITFTVNKNVLKQKGL